MSSTVEKLWQLQLVMSALHEQEKALEVKPPAFAEIDQEYQAASAKIKELEDKLEEIAKVRRGFDRDLQDAQEHLKKYEGQLMQVKNQQQYAAAWKEIDTARKQVKEIEESILTRMTESEKIESELATLRGSFADLEQTHGREHEAWQASLEGHRREIDILRERSVVLEADLPVQHRSEFHRIYRHRRGIAVVQVVDSACGECRLRIRPQADQQLRRGDLVSCEGCGRVLYLESVSV